MRTFVFASFAVVGLALSVPQAAVAAELEAGVATCPPNTVWDDGRCVRVRPRAYSYAPAPVVVEEPVYVAPPPAVVIGAPLVVAPALGFGFYAGPRWGWGSRTVIVRNGHHHHHFAHHNHRAQAGHIRHVGRR
jgi:hypothetical protein